MRGVDYQQDHGEDLYRRSLYTFWKRTAAPPVMMNFDAAGRESCVVREARTNTPLQALNLMNDVTFLEAARFRAAHDEGGRRGRCRAPSYGFRLALARAPQPKEMEILLDSLRFHRDRFATNPQDAEALLKQGDSPSDPTLNARELAAYASSREPDFEYRRNDHQGVDYGPSQITRRYFFIAVRPGSASRRWHRC